MLRAIFESLLRHFGWESVDHSQGSLGPFGPETPKKSEKKSLPEPPAPGPPRVWKRSRKSLSGPFRDFFQTFSRLFRDFFQTLAGGPGAFQPQEIFGRLFRGLSGPEGPSDPCKWSTGSQTLWVTQRWDRGSPRKCKSQQDIKEYLNQRGT